MTYIYICIRSFWLPWPWCKGHSGFIGRGKHMQCCISYLDNCRPDMTFAVDWALNNNYLSISTTKQARSLLSSILFHMSTAMNVCLISCQNNLMLIFLLCWSTEWACVKVKFGCHSINTAQDMAIVIIQVIIFVKFEMQLWPWVKSKVIRLIDWLIDCFNLV